MTGWLTKRRAGLALLLPSLVVILVATRPWVTGRSTDPVLGGASLSATGNQAAPGLLALGLVALAATVATLTSGPRLRTVSAVVLTLAGLTTLVLTLVVIRDPSGALAGQAGPRVGRSGPVGTSAGLTFWPWPELVASAVLTVVGALTVPAARQWHGLSSRFERPDPAVAERVARASAWDDLSQGVDPTEAEGSLGDPDDPDDPADPDGPGGVDRPEEPGSPRT